RKNPVPEGAGFFALCVLKSRMAASPYLACGFCRPGKRSAPGQCWLRDHIGKRYRNKFKVMF
ncbi:hypothetical protein ACY2O8_002462, partial [Enterobacter hormaechei]